MTVTWLGEHREENGNLNFRIGRAGSDLVAEWAGHCTLRANRSGTSFDLTPAPDANPELIAKLHKGLARALVRHLQGKLTLHASAVSIRGRLVACFGESETGKSTTVAHLAQRPGVVFFADDTAAIEFCAKAVEVVPSETMSWLLPAAHAALGFGETTRKTAVPHAQVATQSEPLVALFHLAFDDRLPGPRVRRLHGQEALSRLLRAAVRFIIDEPAAQLQEFEQLQAVIRAVPVFELARPRGLAALAACGDSIVRILDGIHGGDAP